MQSKGMLDFFKNRNKPVSVSDFLEHSSYDELIEIDLNDSCITWRISIMRLLPLAYTVSFTGMPRTI